MTDDLKPELRHDLPPSWARDRRPALVSELRGSGGARRRRRWLWRGLIVVPVASLVAAGGVALLGDTPTIDAADCFPHAERSAVATASAQEGIDDPVAGCRKQWQAGNVAPTTKAPPLVGCIAPGQVSVYPGRGEAVCKRLGMDPLPGDFGSTARRSSDFDARMHRALKDCPSVKRAKGIARAELDRAGRKSWKVRIRPDQGDVARRDCVDNFGTVENSGESSRVELDYPVHELSDAEDKRAVQKMKAENCRQGGDADPVDASLAATECRYDLMAKCIPPRLAAAELRRQFARRGVDTRVKVDFDAPNRCWKGYANNGNTATVLSQAR